MAKDASTGRAASDGTLELLLKLNRAAQRATVYPEGHPSVAAAVALCHRSIEALLAERGVLALGVTRERLLVDEQPFDSGGEVLEWLTRRLYDQGIGTIAFARGLTEKELSALVAWLASKGVAGEPPTLRHAAVTLVDYARARFDEDRRTDETDDADAMRIWKSLLAGITSGWYQRDPARLPEDPGACAAELCAEIERNEGLGASTFLATVVGTVMRLPKLSEPARQVVRARLSDFVGGLSPQLQRQLLHVDPTVSARKLDFLAEMSGALPDTLLMEVLADLDARGERISDSFVDLLNRLIGLSVRDPILRELAETKLVTFGLPRGLTLMEPSHVRAALEETLMRRSDEQFNPGDYQPTLAGLSAGSLKPARPWSRYHDISSPEAVASHLSDIVLRLLVASPEHPGAAAYMSRLTDELPRALAGARFAQLHEVAASLKDLLVLRNYIPGEVVRQVEEYLAALRRPEVVRMLLAAIEDVDAPPTPDVEGLVRLGGAETACLALERVAALEQGAPRTRLVDLLSSLRPEVFAEVVADARARGGSRVHALFAVLARAGTPGRVECALTFLGNRDPGVRILALSLLLEADTRPGQRERYLQRAFVDRAREVRQFAIEASRNLGDSVAVASLRSFLLGARPVRADVATRLRAIDILGELGTPESRAALSELLHVGRLRLRPADVRLCRAAAARLALVADAPAQTAVRTWRRSPSGWLAWLLSHPAEEGA